jgi:PAS domain S-box-containing protein
MGDTHADYSRLAELVGGLGLHQHLCLIYDTQEEQFAAALPYLTIGLERGEKCLYIADENSAAAILDALRKGGTGVDRYLRSGALNMVDRKAVYLKTGRFEPDLVIRFWTEAVSQARADKFSGLRTLVAEMTWVLGESVDTHRLIEYESKLNRLVRDHEAVIVCQYNRARFPPEVILGVVRTHPLVIYGGIVCKNPYYVPPDEFLKPNQPALEVERLLNNILAWERDQQALRHSEEHLRLVIDTVPALIHTGLPDGYLDFFNRRWLNYVGLSLEDLLGWKWTALIHPEDVEAMVEKWRAALAAGEPLVDEARVRRADGEYRWMLHRKVPLRDEGGNIVKWYGSGIDIEDRKRAEDDLRKQKEILQKIFDNVPAMIRFVAPNGKTRLVNREWESTMGWTLEEILAQDLDVFAELYPDPKYRQEVMKFVFSSNPEFVVRTRVRDGRVIDTSWASVRLSDGTAIGIGRDITEQKRAEEALCVTEERWRAVFENSAVGIALTDPDGKFLSTNHAYQEMVGYTDEELRALSYVDITYEEDREINRDLVAELVEGKRQQFSLEKRYRRKNGTLIWVRVSVSQAYDTNGKFQFAMAVVEDITERRRAEDDLRRQKEVLQKIFDNAPVMIAFLGPDAKLSLLNRELERTLGWTLEEMRAHDPNDLLAEFYPDPQYRQEAIEFMSSASPKFADLTVRVRAGQLIGTSWGKVRLSDGTEIYIGLDITERKRAEEELRQTEERIRAILEYSPNWIFLKDTEGRYLLVNREIERMFGISQEQIKGKTDSEIFPPEQAAEYRANDLKVLRAGLTMEFEEIALLEDGPHTSIVHKFPLFDTQGNIYATGGVATDITEHVRAEEALRKSEERWRSVFENSAIGVALTDLDGHFLATNPVYQKMVGYNEEELGRLSFLDITQEDFREANWTLITELLEGKRRQFQIEKQYRRKDGSLVWVRNTVSLVPGTGSVPRFIMALSEDITERKKAEEALRDSEERFRTTFENAGVAMALIDMQGHPVKSNPALRRMLGYSEAELTRMAFTEFTHPDDRDLDWGLYGELTAGKRDKYEIEKRYLQKGGGVVWGLLTVSLVKGKHGRPVYAVGMVQDITERRRAEEELQRSRDQLRALAARAETVREEERTRVAREIHDELGQALTGIKLDLSSLARELPADKKPQARAVLALVDETIQSVRRISTELRPAILDTLGLVPALEWAAEEFQARTGIECRLDLPGQEIAAEPDRATALFRIFQEALTNVVRHANATQVDVRLATKNGDLSLEIRDNGQGISDEQLSAAASLGILGMQERSLLLGGELTIRGTPGEGTTVRVRIPAAAHS